MSGILKAAKNPEYDLLVIGGGINGSGIARDAAGRGLKVCLVEMGDLGGGTSSASTKLFHGGLRYLEYFEFRLVREALIEREVLLKAMPHISWPMRFVLPYSSEMRFDLTTPLSKLLGTVMPWMRGRRPAWLIRLGLFLYDSLGGRKILPGTKSVDLAKSAEGMPLNDKFKKAFEYSDCWIEDARLVVLNARDAQERGATISTREKAISADVSEGVWSVVTQDRQTQQENTRTARMIVNAAGPHVGQVLRGALKNNGLEDVRLVRGSHIVTRRLFEHDKCYFFQGRDGRIIFAIPYETDFTLIGTTDIDHPDLSIRPKCTPEEQDYLIDFVNQYISDPISRSDIIWTYSGLRPLYDDGAGSASAATRDYVLKVDKSRGAPVLNVFGGKITTYRRLAESALEIIGNEISLAGKAWTAGVSLPGGDFEVGAQSDLVGEIIQKYDFIDEKWAQRLVRAYGTEAQVLLSNSESKADLGRDFGATLTEAEVSWLMEKEFARRAEDVVWRRSKLGLRMTPEQIDELDRWMIARSEARAPKSLEQKEEINVA